MKKLLAMFVCLFLASAVLAGCGAKKDETAAADETVAVETAADTAADTAEGEAAASGLKVARVFDSCIEGKVC